MQSTSNIEKLKKEIALLPELPGVYRYFDDQNKLIYVGKAKCLKKRVASYFVSIQLKDRKTQSLVSQIEKLQYTIVNTEFDALLLENILIKQFQPKYNILLRDDKTYPFVCITEEHFPRIFSTRKPDKSEGKIFGPYSNVKAMFTILELVKKLFYVRNCTLLLNPKNIEAKKFNVCLEYHIGNCKGPCEAKQTEVEYLSDIKLATKILNHNINPVREYFEKNMIKMSEEYQFEKANEFKKKLELLHKFQQGSLIVSYADKDLEVYTIESDEKVAFINILEIKEGYVTSVINKHIDKVINESDEEILTHTLLQFRETKNSITKEVISNIDFSFELPDIQINNPKIGYKKKLIDLSLKNLEEYKNKYIIEKQELNIRIHPALSTLQKDLQLKKIPFTIECFDNSNLQGTNAVSSMVTFYNGKPKKSDYKIFNVQTVTGPNDFDTMREVIFRRYKRVIEENKPKPDLIIVDGGKGQLSSACDSLKELGIYGLIPIIGIAKRLEEIYVPEDELPILLSKKSISLQLIQQLRDEAHRFGITRHRNLRSKEMTKVELPKGMGEKSYLLVIKKYKALKSIKEEDRTEIEKLIGNKKSDLLFEHLKI